MPRRIHPASAFRVADHGRGIVREVAGHRLQVAYVAVDHAEEREDGGMVGGDGELFWPKTIGSTTAGRRDSIA
jgi:hypothetical protein